jgi:hypothetical protein
MTTGTKVLKSIEKFKHKMLASSGSHSGSVTDDGSTDLDPDLSLDLGAEYMASVWGRTMASRWIRTRSALRPI